VAPSQHEIDMRYDNALAMADKTMTYRIVVKEVAAWHGYYATFMPKPLFGENGSGMHTHMSLFKGGRNMFFDAKDANHLSETAKSFIAGLLVHAREMSAVLAQWVNSYNRLVPATGRRRLVAAELGRLIRSLAAGSAQATGRDPPRPRLQPYPPRRCRVEGSGEGLQAAGRDDELMPAPTGARKQGIDALPAHSGAIEELALEAAAEGPRRAHLPATWS
jgi:glutamine synthetase